MENKAIAKAVGNVTRFCKRNSLIFLAAAGVAGLVGTVITTAKAAPTILEKLKAEEEKKGRELNFFEKVRVSAKDAAVPALFTGATAGTIIGMSVKGAKTQAALIGAYGMLDNSFRNYKKKVEELTGVDEKTVQTEIAKENVPEKSEESEKTLFYDTISERYFHADYSDVIAACYEMNHKFQLDGYVELNKLYELINSPELPKVDYGDQLGWGCSEMLYEMEYCWIDFGLIPFKTDDGLEGYSLQVMFGPSAEFLDFDYCEH